MALTFDVDARALANALIDRYKALKAKPTLEMTEHEAIEYVILLDYIVRYSKPNF